MIKPISKKKYYETISEQIEEAILSGEWAEGSRVPTEDELAKIFRVGRGSIREDITNLQVSGVLNSSPGIGTYVADNAIACINNHRLADMLNDPESLDDMTEARQILEPQLAAYAAENASKGDLKQLQKALENAKTAQTPEDWKEKGHQFHLTLAECCGNKILVSLFKSIEEPTRKQFNESADEAKIAQWIELYEMIYGAIAQGDAAKASRFMTELLD